jgi:hypothetical protein
MEKMRFVPPGSDDLHFRPTDRANDWCSFCLGRTKHSERVDPKDQLQKPNEVFTARVEETVTAYPSKPLGKYVQHKQVEELFPPQPCWFIDARPRHEDMNVGMIDQGSGVGMEHGGKSRFTSEFFVVSGEGLQGISDTGKQEGIDRLLISPGKIPELPGGGECDQVIRGRQLFVQLLFDPLAVFMVLAMGAVPVAAGMGNVAQCSAVMVRTACQYVRTVCLPALRHDL